MAITHAAAAAPRARTKPATTHPTEQVGELVVKTSGGFVGPGDFRTPLSVAEVIGASSTLAGARHLARQAESSDSAPAEGARIGAVAIVKTGRDPSIWNLFGLIGGRPTFNVVRLDHPLTRHDIHSSSSRDIGTMGTVGSSSDVVSTPGPHDRVMLEVVSDGESIAI